MTWNWQLPDWPNFKWNASELAQLEQQFLLASGELIGVLKHLQPLDRDELTIGSLSEEAIRTSEIEGEILDRASVQSSIKRQLGMAEDSRNVAPAERGIAEMMVEFHRTFGDPMTDSMLCALHRMLMQGRTGLNSIGSYRTHDEPMQIVSSGRVSELPNVHYEAPPSIRVAGEMDAFIAWFNGSGPGGLNPLPSLTRAAIAHLHFESIHPFEDGNGRIGRGISEKVIAQNLGYATSTALASVILGRRKAYYDALERASRTLEITEWILWFADATMEGQRRTAALVEFLLAKTRLLDNLRGKLNPRQEKALVRMFREGLPGFKGGLSAANYMRITDASTATTSRDLADLVELGALIRVGEKRHARYHLSICPARE